MSHVSISGFNGALHLQEKNSQAHWSSSFTVEEFLSSLELFIYKRRIPRLNGALHLH